VRDYISVIVALKLSVDEPRRVEKTMKFPGKNAGAREETAAARGKSGVQAGSAEIVATETGSEFRRNS